MLCTYLSLNKPALVLFLLEHQIRLWTICQDYTTVQSLFSKNLWLLPLFLLLLRPPLSISEWKWQAMDASLNKQRQTDNKGIMWQMNLRQTSSWQNSQGEVQIFFTAAVVVVNQSFTVVGPAQVLKTQLIYFGSVESWSCSYGTFSWILDESHCARWEAYLSLNFSEMVIWNWTRSVMYKSGKITREKNSIEESGSYHLTGCPINICSHCKMSQMYLCLLKRGIIREIFRHFVVL